MRIRPFEPADAAAVNAVAVSSFAQYRGVYNDWDRFIAGVGTMAALNDEGEIVVAPASDGSLAGAVAYFGPGAPKAEFFEPEWSIIRMLVVDPARRGGGVGRQLTDTCIALAQRGRARVIALHTSPVMEVALAMYLRMGFTFYKAVPDRFGVPYGVYTRRLEPHG